MNELTFHQKQKILSSKANFEAFGRALIKKAFENRCRSFNKEATEDMLKHVNMIATHYINEYWEAFEDHTEHNLKLFLSLFNFNGEWDTPGSGYRTHPGIEELLERIEPKEVFEHLHGETNIYTYQTIHEVISDNP